MTYTPSVPTGPQFISASQPIIRDNFIKADTDFTVDHNTFQTIGPTVGQHKRITFTNVEPVPPNTFIFPLARAFTQTSTGANQYNDLYFAHKGSTSPGADPVSVLRLTGGGITAAAWVRYNGTGPVGSIAPISAYNVSNVEKLSTTQFRIDFIRPFANVNYLASAPGGAHGLTNYTFTFGSAGSANGDQAFIFFGDLA